MPFTHQRQAPMRATSPVVSIALIIMTACCLAIVSGCDSLRMMGEVFSGVAEPEIVGTPASFDGTLYKRIAVWTETTKEQGGYAIEISENASKALLDRGYDVCDAGKFQRSARGLGNSGYSALSDAQRAKLMQSNNVSAILVMRLNNYSVTTKSRATASGTSTTYTTTIGLSAALSSDSGKLVWSADYFKEHYLSSQAEVDGILHTIAKGFGHALPSLAPVAGK